MNTEWQPDLQRHLGRMFFWKVPSHLNKTTGDKNTMKLNITKILPDDKCYGFNVCQCGDRFFFTIVKPGNAQRPTSCDNTLKSHIAPLRDCTISQRLFEVRYYQVLDLCLFGILTQRRSQRQWASSNRLNWFTDCVHLLFPAQPGWLTSIKTKVFN